MDEEEDKELGEDGFKADGLLDDELDAPEGMDLGLDDEDPDKDS